METKRHPIGPDDLDVISAIWMLSCNDPDTIMTYKGIAHRLALKGWDVERVRHVVQSRAELFSPVVSSRWFKEWQEWIKKEAHYPGWVLELTGKAARDKAIDDLTRQDVFRCQFRNDNRPTDKTDPCVPVCDTDQVKLGIEHLDRLRKAGAEERDERLKYRTTVIVPVVALLLTSLVGGLSTLVSYWSLQNSRHLAQQTADLTRADELVKLWDLSTRMRGNAYEGVFNSMQSASDAALAGNKEETGKQLIQVRSDFYRLEIVIDDPQARKQLWNRYGEFKQLCSDALANSGKSSVSLPLAFENLQNELHHQLYDLLFVRTPDEDRAYQRLMQADSAKSGSSSEKPVKSAIQ